MSDNVFRFLLKDPVENRVSKVNDFIGLHLRELCDLLIPVKGVQDLTIDSYRLLNDRDTLRPLYPPEEEPLESDVNPLDLYEPRIGYLRRVLESILNIVDLEADGKAVVPDAFRLKDPGKWLAPSGGANDILAHAGSRCNLNCRFCYNESAPPVLRPKKVKPEDEFREIQTRIKHYVPSAKLNIFPDMGSPAEILIHPHILEILKELRGKTDELFRIPTNGSTLTPQMIRSLASFKPVYLDVSLNSAWPSRRQWLMRDPEPETALNSLGLLKEAGIPFSIVVVPWPFPTVEEMLNDLRETVLFAADNDPTLIQISLPGYTTHVSAESAFSSAEVWRVLKNLCLELREVIDCPLVIRPGVYEEQSDSGQLNRPTIVGVIKNSPVHLAGLRRDDRILEINGLPVYSRPQARSLLTTLHQSQLSGTTLTVDRNGKIRNLDVDLTVFDYPYTSETGTHLGAVFSSSGIPMDWMEKLKEVISAYRAKEVLLLTSTLVRPYFENLCCQSGFPGGVNLHLKVPSNRYFGGNIHMGDLLVVSDFVDAVEEFLTEEKFRPDLVVIPSSPFSLSGWGRDLTGHVYREIERRTGIPTTLAECVPIFD